MELVEFQMFHNIACVFILVMQGMELKKLPEKIFATASFAGS